MARPPKGERKSVESRYVLLKWEEGWKVDKTFVAATTAYKRAVTFDGEYIVVNPTVGYIDVFEVFDNMLNSKFRSRQQGFYLMNQGGYSNRCTWLAGNPPLVPLNWVWLVTPQSKGLRVLEEAETRLLWPGAHPI